tara:strand:+ start:45 stop:518 length:474 start_codon:yes stop_codon:yes gene_type:complete
MGSTIQVENRRDLDSDREDPWVYVTCPNCNECEGQSVDEPRHHLQGFTFVDQGYTATDDDTTEMECNTCNIPFSLIWDYTNVVEEDRPRCKEVRLTLKDRLIIQLEGLSTAHDDDVVYIEFYNGQWQVMVWGDVNKDDYTQKIVLDKAWTSMRKEEE